LRCKLLAAPSATILGLTFGVHTAPLTEIEGTNWPTSPSLTRLVDLVGLETWRSDPEQKAFCKRRGCIELHPFDNPTGSHINNAT